MAAPHRHWKVLPHGTLTPLDDSILTIVGQIKMPAGELPRRMTAARRALGVGSLAGPGKGVESRPPASQTGPVNW